ncbi:MAG: ArsR/SmtB family transcription factor [Solirubrobacteraceae bacterium]
MTERARRRITDPEVLKGLTHPLRRRVFRLLAQFGPATVTTLAQRTGADPGRMSYHVRELAKRGFIEPAPELARDGRESWWRLVPGSVSWSSTDMADPADRAVTDALHDVTVADEFERLQVFEAAIDSWGPEWAAAAETSNSYLRATPQELRELTAQINDLIIAFRDVEGRSTDRSRAADQADDGRESVFIFMHAFPERP